MKKVAVTGGSGELGTVLLRRLVADPAVGEVICIDRQAPLVLHDKVRVLYADVRDPALEGQLIGCDALCHLAFAVAKNLPLDEYRANNVEGSRAVFMSAIRAGIKKVLYMSSVAAYGNFPDHPVPIVETTPRRYLESFPYSASKFEVEAILDELEPQHLDVAFVRFRAGVFYGLRGEGWVGWIRRQGIISGFPFVRQTAVWNDDVAQAFQLALHKDVRGAFNVTAESELTPQEMARACGFRVFGEDIEEFRRLNRRANELTRRGVFEVAHPSWLQSGMIEMIFSSRKAIEELGWKPMCPTCADVMRRLAEVAPRQMDRRMWSFVRLARVLASRAPLPAPLDTDLRLLVELTTPAGGDFSVAVENGRLFVQEGLRRPFTATMTLEPSTMIALLLGDADLADCERAGAVSLAGPSRDQVAKLIAWFRDLCEEDGAEGRGAKRLARALQGARRADLSARSGRYVPSVPPTLP